jgi:hypothetical protein
MGKDTQHTTIATFKGSAVVRVVASREHDNYMSMG